MYKFIITIELKEGAREKILARAPAVQAATRAQAGCLAYDFFTCTDDPDRLVFVEAWVDEAAHEIHMAQAYTRDFIAFHTPFHRALTFERIIPVA
ncbi:Putative monooxygenase YcnE [Aquimixticola soesokkakensis]|uniref:Putative monooxygenase YcnE n=1 Tax=Aquimixticola soesokkakensis TaxID=1519096 RepID=A0A1Y5TMW2_9RHOB|nr:putative quinol monooxygenase [Aquimixticola soesokkakensis]SLN67732.1 Putative monooxygenase YcnE [Aquimixticola soesokkakensis]